MKLLNRNVAPEIREFPLLRLPEMEKIQKDGMAPIKYYNGGDQPLCRVTIAFNSGLADFTNPAAAMILSQLVMEGTSRYTGQQLSEQLDYNGSWLKVDMDNHFCEFILHTPNDTFNDSIELLRDIVFDASLPEDEFEKIKDRFVATAEINQTKVKDVAMKEMKRCFFGENHPIAQMPPSADMYRSVTLSDVKDIYKYIHQYSFPSITLSGQLDNSLGRVIDLFGDFRIPSEITLPKIYPANYKVGIKREIIVEGASQSAVIMVLPSIPRSHPDYINLRYSIMALGGYFGSELMSEVREKMGLTYDISAALLGYKEGTMIKITSQTGKENVKELIEATINVAERMKTVPLSQENIDSLKSHAISSLATTLDSPYSIADYRETIERIDAPNNYFSLQQQSLQQLTPDIIMEMMSNYFQPDKLIIIEAGM